MRTLVPSLLKLLTRVLTLDFVGQYDPGKLLGPAFAGTSCSPDQYACCWFR